MSDVTEVSLANEAKAAMTVGDQAWQANRLDEAEAAYARAAQLLPQLAAAHANLGVVLRRQGRSLAAVASYRRSLACNPDDPGVWSNLGNALRELGRLEDAETALKQAVALAPGNMSFLYNLGLGLRDCRKHAEALRLLEAVAAARPDDKEVLWDLALSRLGQGDYAGGFAGYEARLGLARNVPRAFAGPRWSGGEDIAGKTVLLHSEQGFGDALQFARFVPLVAAKGCRIVLECLPEMKELFAALPGVVAVVDKHAPPPPYDLWAPMLSLPHLLGITGESLPAQVPYLLPPAHRRLSVQRPPGTTLSVGLVWAGKTTPRDRSWPLEQLLPLLEDPRVAFYSLQMGPRAADLRRLGLHRLVRDVSPHITSFADTATLMAQLDLVITIDTSAAHLAGALGRPVWVLLRYVSDWRWQDEPLDSPWYPTMRLFRQPHPDDFSSPVARLTEALRQAASHP
jgi:Tfp pilus assembly protein PilF